MRRSIAVGLAILAVAAVAGTPGRAADDPPPVESLRLPGGPTSATDRAPVDLAVDLYRPAVTPASAVVLAHGFGGSKQSVAQEAQEFVERGFVVLAYTARGFGTSTGTISMNSPDYEIADARAMIDALGDRPDIVVQDGDADPRVGFAGGSYGGALALMTAGYDQRVDAVAADITWNDLRTSLFGQSVAGAGLGVFKQWWAGSFFGVGLLQPGASATACGRFAPDWCQAFEIAAERGAVTPGAAALMARSSPRSVAGRITAPTLIGAGQADSLFPFAQAAATVDQIRAAQPQTPVKVVWHGGGHDGGVDESERLRDLAGDWMQAHLAAGPPVPTDYEITLTNGGLGADSRREPTVVSLPQFPGIGGNAPQSVTLAGPDTQVRAPAGGAPAAITSFPGLGGVAGQVGFAPPGQSATFDSEPVSQDLTLAGAPRIRLRVSAGDPVRDVALFASLRLVSPAGTETTPQGLVAPIRLPRLGPDPVDIDVELPAIATRVAPGDRLRLVVTTTDAAYRLPDRAAIYEIGLADGGLILPVIDGASDVGRPISGWLLLVFPILAALSGLVVLVRPRTPRPQSRPDLADTPVTIRAVSKAFSGGVVAVDDVSFDVPRGIVMGLLGPNGAGKTTTMRMLMGLISPTAGEMYVFGERVHPGAPVLARIGSLVEGAGFLPHLTGRQNLDLYWRAAGRDGTPNFDEVLDIAGLGHAVDRKVKSYSQGMRQRLGIAQAMLGNPDILLLDEPTNGLDPPQIREMRDVLRDYAATGRTVIVSSHMLAEVEMTCTHVVVMHRGRMVAQGEVADLMAGRTDGRLEDVFLEIVGADRTVGGG